MAITLNPAQQASHSIYRHLTGWLLGGVGILLLGLGVMLETVVGGLLKDEYDQSLLAKARILVTLTEQDREGVELDLTDEVMPEFDSLQDSEYFQLWLADGTVLERSNSLADGDLVRLTEWSENPRFADLTLPDGRSGRRVQIDFLPHLDQDEDEQDGDPLSTKERVPQPVTLVMARERERLDTSLGTLRLTLLTAGIIAMGLTAVLVRLTIRISLRPLADIRAQVARFDAYSLAARLQPQQRTEELDGVVNQFNALLDRLQTVFERERQFSADVAHELRTPLAELRNLAEVGSRWSDDPLLAQDFFDEVLGATRQMERIVINLLALARCDKDLEVIEPTEVDLATLIDMAWQRVLPEAQTKQLAFRRQGPDTLKTKTGRDPFELILNNLFSNAVEYSPAGSEITCTVNNNAGAITLSVINPTEHLTADDLPHLFDRLWRKDQARTGDRHAGLGLSLVKAYAEQLQLKVEVALEPDRLFRVTLIQPAPAV